MIAVYVVLVPIMIFFTLKDKDKLLTFARTFVPKRSELTFQVWREVDAKIANYIRGKFVEVLIVWAVTYILFAVMGLNYSLLLSFLVGLSVIIPYVGAVVVTVPIALIGFFQWGFVPKLGYLLLAYQVVQILDGNVLVPLLFSEVVNLHPLAIITAVLFFGGLFGLWGVFFAIPLAALVQAVMNAWPRAREHLPHKD
jgi:putative permease